MKPLLLLPLVFALCACATLADRCQADRHQNALIDHIEQQARMPVGAHALGDYARRYTFAADGDVVGLFWVPSMFGDGKNRPANLRAGQRIWQDSHTATAWGIADGGCLVLDLVFDPKTDRIKSFVCHGYA